MRKKSLRHVHQKPQQQKMKQKPKLDKYSQMKNMTVWKKLKIKVKKVKALTGDLVRFSYYYIWLELGCLIVSLNKKCVQFSTLWEMKWTWFPNCCGFPFSFPSLFLFPPFLSTHLSLQLVPSFHLPFASITFPFHHQYQFPPSLLPHPLSFPFPSSYHPVCLSPHLPPSIRPHNPPYILLQVKMPKRNRLTQRNFKNCILVWNLKIPKRPWEDIMREKVLEPWFVAMISCSAPH